jgi:SnoaL-like domain
MASGSDHVAVVHRYHTVWTEVDVETRLGTLGEIWADEGVYLDPDVPDGVVGREALSALIDASVAQFPGLDIAATSDVAVLGDRAWYRWRATTRDGETFDGTDFFEFDAEGRIQRLTDFFDP